MFLHGCLLILAIGTFFLSSFYSNKSSNDEKHKLRHFTNTIYTVAIMLWPVLFDYIVGFNKLQSDIPLWFGFLWPFALFCVHLQKLNSVNRYVDQEAFQRHGELKQNANALIASAFAFGSLLAVIKSTKEGQSSDGARIIMISLLMCIAFLLPSSSFATTTYEAHKTRSVQNCILNMAIGLFISGIVVSWSSQNHL